MESPMEDAKKNTSWRWHSQYLHISPPCRKLQHFYKSWQLEVTPPSLGLTKKAGGVQIQNYQDKNGLLRTANPFRFVNLLFEFRKEFFFISVKGHISINSFAFFVESSVGYNSFSSGSDTCIEKLHFFLILDVFLNFSPFSKFTSLNFMNKIVHSYNLKIPFVSAWCTWGKRHRIE